MAFGIGVGAGSGFSCRSLGTSFVGADAGSVVLHAPATAAKTTMKTVAVSAIASMPCVVGPLLVLERLIRLPADDTGDEGGFHAHRARLCGVAIAAVRALRSIGLVGLAFALVLAAACGAARPACELVAREPGSRAPRQPERGRSRVTAPLRTGARP